MRFSDHQPSKRLQPVEPAELSSDMLRHAARHSLRNAAAFRFGPPGKDDAAEVAELVAFEETGRFGIAWQGREWWLDAASPDDAIQRWIADQRHGSGRRPAARSPGR